MRVVIYEDKTEDFYPLVNLLPQFRLRLGMMTIAEHVATFLRAPKADFVARPDFGFQRINPRERTLYLSGRFLMTEQYALPKNDTLLENTGEAVGFIRSGAPFPGSIDEIYDTLATMKGAKQVSGILIRKPWDLIAHEDELMHLQFRKKRRKSRDVLKEIHLRGNPKDLFVAEGAYIHRQVFLDVTDGPIYIDKGSEIRPFTTITGPSYVGRGTIVERAKISNSSIGPECRIGGEVEACIFQGYANKHHDGFIGHSYIGEWVNLGALSTNSDLKNNYGPVRLQIGRDTFDSGMMKLGCFIGDHTKLGIGTLIPTGAVIGSFVNSADAGMMPKFVPDFRWLARDEDTEYNIEKAINTARTAMKRRNVELSAEYEELIRRFHGQIRSSN
jgi:UDP-N-acetylglucosamine diphosphorylase/glucosamine-1-phosphate N-acetyltransferase